MVQIKKEFDDLYNQAFSDQKLYTDLKSAIESQTKFPEFKRSSKTRRKIMRDTQGNIIRSKSKLIESADDTNSEMKRINLGRKVSGKKLNTYKRDLRSYNVSPEIKRNSPKNLNASLNLK